MGKTVNEQLLDSQVAQSIRWHRVATGQANVMKSVVHSVDSAIRAVLLADDISKYTIEQAGVLTARVEAIIRDMHRSKIAPAMTSFAQDVAEHSAEAEADLLRRTL